MNVGFNEVEIKMERYDEKELIKKDRWPSVCWFLPSCHRLQLVLRDSGKSVKDHQHEK